MCWRVKNKTEREISFSQRGKGSTRTATVRVYAMKTRYVPEPEKL